jgi:hypothetical protein
MARNRSKLPAGWSRPVKPSEISQTFPGAGHVYWNGPPATWRDRHGPAGHLAELGTAISDAATRAHRVAVPSANRAAIRQWINQTVAPQATRWLLALESRSPVWQDTRHWKTWNWKPDTNQKT